MPKQLPMFNIRNKRSGPDLQVEQPAPVFAHNRYAAEFSLSSSGRHAFNDIRLIGVFLTAVTLAVSALVSGCSYISPDPALAGLPDHSATGLSASPTAEAVRQALGAPWLASAAWGVEVYRDAGVQTEVPMAIIIPTGRSSQATLIVGCGLQLCPAKLSIDGGPTLPIPYRLNPAIPGGNAPLITGNAADSAIPLRASNPFPIRDTVAAMRVSPGSHTLKSWGGRWQYGNLGGLISGSGAFAFTAAAGQVIFVMLEVSAADHLPR